MVTRHCGDHFALYTNVKSLCHIQETNIVLCVNYMSIKNIVCLFKKDMVDLTQNQFHLLFEFYH